MNLRTAILLLFAIIAGPVFAQAPPSFPPDQLDQLVARIALYPDPLLAQILAGYDPGIVFLAPRPGFVVGGAIRFGFGVTIGGFFRPWGWGFGRFDWGGHSVFINNEPWRRTWVNRGAYVHPYAGVRRFAPAERAPERHELHERSERERAAPREGRRPVEEHRGGGRERR